MKRLLIILCLLLCLVLTGCGKQENTPETPSQDVPVQNPAQEEVLDETPGETETVDEAAAQTEHPAAYLLVTVANNVYEPIPMQEPGRYTVRRGDHVNVIEVTADSVWMAESSCDNQDCVYQGVVSLENKSQRVLQNMIICLPNEVMLELYTYEELQQVLPGWPEGQE